MSRKPQFRLPPCGHLICKTCVRIFGECREQDPWVFNIQSCFFYRLKTSNVTVKVKPDTASVRILSIDRGGVRGIVPRQILKLLEDKVGLPYPIQKNLDSAFGISSGELSSLMFKFNTDLPRMFEHSRTVRQWVIRRQLRQLV